MRIRPAADLAFVGEGEGADMVLHVTTIPDGSPLVLNATAGAILRTALALADRDAVITDLSRRTGMAAAAIAPDIDAVLTALAERGILVLDAAS